MTKHHVLMVGLHGTSKSKMTNKLFSAFTDARVFNTQCTKFMTEDVVLGVPNVKTMQEEGLIEYVTTGMIPEAHFAFLDELMDANEPVLRALLDILNERVFRRGRQFMECPLRTAIATTNFMKTSEQVAAVVDRFLIKSKVSPLESDDSVQGMLRGFLGERKCSPEFPTVTLEELDQVFDLVNSVTMSDEMIVLCNELIRQYNTEGAGTVFISDRRKCWTTQLACAQAVLSGRDSVEPEDLKAVRFGLVTLGEDKEEQWFDEAYSKVVRTYGVRIEARESLSSNSQSAFVTPRSQTKNW